MQRFKTGITRPVKKDSPPRCSFVLDSTNERRSDLPLTGDVGSKGMWMNDSVDIVAYTKNLGSKFTGIRQIWLFGSRANAAAKSDSDWDLMLFADEQTFHEMSVHPEFKHPMIDLLVVNADADGGRTKLTN